MSQYHFRRILVVSNNSFSDVNNNGKTLVSFFLEVPRKYIAQLYFHNEVPVSPNCSTYYKITDYEILTNVFKVLKYIPKRINSSIKEEHDKMPTQITPSMRIFRDILWKIGKWKSANFLEWLDGYQPQIVFFVAGDSGFTYDIARYIAKRYHAKIVTYFTDDYILPRLTFSIAWWLRSLYLKEKMRRIIKDSSLLITISEEMRNIYRELFGKDSICLMNVSEDLCNKNYCHVNSIIKFVYVGTLSYQRENTLNLLANAISNYNKTSEKKAMLEIYLGQTPEKEQIDMLEIPDASCFCGTIGREQVKEVLNASDILVHIESFKGSCKAATRLSISTKIAEYLSVGKCLLAIGPNEVASMRYLNDCAACVTSPDGIDKMIEKLINDTVFRENIGRQCREKYEKYLIPSYVRMQFMQHLFDEE